VAAVLRVVPRHRQRALNLQSLIDSVIFEFVTAVTSVMMFFWVTFEREDITLLRNAGLYQPNPHEIKGKVVPLRSIEAHLGDRRYSSYSFLTSTLEGVSG
jgi:hypothetical protein